MPALITNIWYLKIVDSLSPWARAISIQNCLLRLDMICLLQNSITHLKCKVLSCTTLAWVPQREKRSRPIENDANIFSVGNPQLTTQTNTSMLFNNDTVTAITIQLHFSTFWGTFCKIWLFLWKISLELFPFYKGSFLCSSIDK